MGDELHRLEQLNYREAVAAEEEHREQRKNSYLWGLLLGAVVFGSFGAIVGLFVGAFVNR